MGLRWREILGVAVVIPVVSLCAVWAARKLGHWIMDAIARSFGQVVLEVMAPDMAHLSTKVAASLDELRYSNGADHAIVQEELVGVKGRLTDVENRLANVENRLGIRPPDARTRATDIERQL